MKLVLCLLIFVCGARPGWSQVSEVVLPRPVLPSGPLLCPPADFSRWEITFTYPDEEKKKDKATHKTKSSSQINGSLPRKIITTKTGRIVHEQCVDALNRVTDTWFDAGSRYTKSASDPEWYRSDKPSGSGAEATNYRPLPSIGYRDVDIIKGENYAGIISHDNRDCLIFIPGGGKDIDLKKTDEAQKKLKTIDEIAYVDAESRLPVALRTRSELRTFQFDLPPTEMQILPVDLDAQKNVGEDARTRLNQTAPRPY